MLHASPRPIPQGTALLRIVLATVVVVWSSFGHAHFLHAPPRELDLCGRACPLHLTAHSVDSDPDACGICRSTSAYGFDFDLHARFAADAPGAIDDLEPAPQLPDRRIFGPATPRGPPLI